MRPLQEETRVGLAALEMVTTLLRRRRADHPTAGPYEAADHQWAWRRPRATDGSPQLFWLDDGRPVAAAIAIEDGDEVLLDVVVLPDAAPALVAEVAERGLAHAAALALGPTVLEVAEDDTVLADVLVAHGFAVTGPGVVECWLDVADRPPVAALTDGYRLASRAETLDRPHHMTHAGRNHPDAEPRLRQTSLYRADLDLVVLAPDDTVAAYGLFWSDPVSATGLVEPMRTEDDHQRHGLARHVLTAGLDRLAAAGAERVKICFEADNPASSHLYPSVGFVPDRSTVLFGRRGA